MLIVPRQTYTNILPKELGVLEGMHAIVHLSSASKITNVIHS